MRLRPLLALGLGVLLGAADAAPPTSADPAAAMRALVRTYWDASERLFYTYSDQKTHPEHGSGPVGGLYSDFWWTAQLWDVVMDAWQATGQPQYRAMIAQVYDGFAAQYPDWSNDYNDDLGWWAKAALRAYTLTGEERYLKRSRALAEQIWISWDTDNGGLWWRRSVRDQKNVATNAPFVTTLARLYGVSRDPADLERAKQVWDWLSAHLIDGERVYDHLNPDGSVTKWDFTYNFGTVMEAALALYRVTGEKTYLDTARRGADWALANLTNDGILLDEGANDGGGFKGVFVRALAELATVTGDTRYLQALRDQGASAWNARRADSLTGTSWAAPAPASEAVQSLTAASATAAVLLGGPQPARVPFGLGPYQAENARRIGVESANRATGFLGRGYVNNFHLEGQAVVFEVNVPSAGRYELTFRYSAGGGAATRHLDIGGASQGAKLPPTPDWHTWREWSAAVTLPAGSTPIGLRVGPDDRGWLNLDALSVSEARP